MSIDEIALIVDFFLRVKRSSRSTSCIRAARVEQDTTRPLPGIEGAQVGGRVVSSTTEGTCPFPSSLQPHAHSLVPSVGRDESLRARADAGPFPTFPDLARPQSHHDYRCRNVPSYRRTRPLSRRPARASRPYARSLTPCAGGAAPSKSGRCIVHPAASPVPCRHADAPRSPPPRAPAPPCVAYQSD